MSKRSYEDKMEYYIRKMDKLEKRRRRQENEPPSTSYWDPSRTQGDETPMGMWQMPDQTTAQAPSNTEAEEEQPYEDNETSEQRPGTQTDPDPSKLSTTPPVQVSSEPTQVSEVEAEGTTFPPLDPDILSALGEATDHGPTWGQEIHNNLTQLWQPLLKQGMTKEARDKIMKEYLIPSNCTLLQAPKLNVEISSAVLEMVRLRDKKVETTQQQLGAGITAVSKAMTSLLTSGDKIEAIKILSDSCRILCDLHHAQTQTRIKMITPGLHKQFINVIQDSERDETLFGVSLPDKIKASKTIEKQGLQIKKPAPPSRLTVNTSASTTRQQYQGNWNGPSRFQGSRGGRGGQKKLPMSATTAAPSRRPAAASTSTTQFRTSQNRSRAPPRH